MALALQAIALSMVLSNDWDGGEKMLLFCYQWKEEKSQRQVMSTHGTSSVLRFVFCVQGRWKLRQPPSFCDVWFGVIPFLWRVTVLDKSVVMDRESVIPNDALPNSIWFGNLGKQWFAQMKCQSR